MSAVLLGLWEWFLALEPLRTLRTLERVGVATVAQVIGFAHLSWFQALSA